MSASNENHPILELRVALTTSEYERSVKFYCNGLGIEPAAIWNNDGGRGRFRFIGLPLKIRGGTGSPVRAIAVFEG